MTARATDRDDVGLLDRRHRQTDHAGMAHAAKGLEFDAVVVVEPAAIAGTHRRAAASMRP